MNYFPTYLAFGPAFCNRKQELRRINQDLQDNTPILIISPRRYGKTSLALKAFEQIKWSYAHVDLYKALTEEDIEKFILQGIGQLIGKIESIPKKLLQLANDFFASLHVKVVVAKTGLELEYNPNKQAVKDLILRSLEQLHELARKRKKHVILFLDEFQVVGEVTKNHSIEALIREAAQKSTYVSYVFSGSNRHLMEQLFYDRKRPFYNLCDQIRIDRIDEVEYIKHINNAAVKNWGKKLQENTLAEIFNLTEFHPYYVNKLCSLLWQNDKFPIQIDVIATWNKIALENKSGIIRELDLLSINQRKLLIFIAKNDALKELYSKDITQRIKLTPSSIQRAIDLLLEKDYVYLNHKKCYRVLDPLIKEILRN